MAAKAGRLLVQIEADIHELRRDMTAATRLFEQHTNSWTRQVKEFSKGFKDAFKITGVAAAATAAISGMSAVLRTTMQQFDQIADGSKRIASSAEEYQKLAFAFKQSGSSAEAMEGAITKMQKSLGEGAAKTGDALKKMGVSVDELRKLSPAEQFARLGGALYDMKDPAEQAAAAAALFGRSFKELRPVIDGGTEAITGLYESADRLGIVLSDEVVAAGEKFNDQLDVMKAQGVKLMADFLGPVIGVLGEVANGFGDTAKEAKEARGEITKFMSVSQALGAFAGAVLAVGSTVADAFRRMVVDMGRSIAATAKILTEGAGDFGTIAKNVMTGNFAAVTVAGKALAEKANAIGKQFTEENRRNWQDYVDEFTRKADAIDAAIRGRVIALPEPPATGAGDGVKESTDRVKKLAEAHIELARAAGLSDKAMSLMQQHAKEAEEGWDKIMQAEVDRMEQNEAIAKRRMESADADRQAAADKAEYQAAQLIEDAWAIGAAFAESSEKGKEALKQLAAQIVAAIAKALILKAIMSALGFSPAPGGGYAPSGGGSVGGLALPPPSVGAFAAGTMAAAPAMATGSFNPAMAASTRTAAVQPMKVEVNNYGGAQVEAKQQGNTLRILVDAVRNTVAADIASGGNAVAAAFEQTYGIRR